MNVYFPNSNHELTRLDYKLDFNDVGLHQISGFDILDISDNGLAKINFQIEDYENDSINFICEEIEIIEVSNPERMTIAKNAW